MRGAAPLTGCATPFGVLAGCATPYGVRHPVRGAAPLAGCATPYGVRHPVRGAPPLTGCAVTGCATRRSCGVFC